MLRTLWVYGVGGVLTAYWSVRVLAIRFLPPNRRARLGALAPRRWASGILRAAGVRVRYENLQGLPPGRAQILVANHQSWFDVFALAGTLPVDYRFVGKKELSKIPLFGPAWLSLGHYAIDRSDRQAAIGSLKAVGRAMRKGGHTVVLFPEGTRSPDGTLGPFKKGAFVMAINTGVPLVPVAILGSDKVMPKGRWGVKGGEILIRVGDAISTDDFTVDQRDRLTRLARERILALKAGPASPSGAGGMPAGGSSPYQSEPSEAPVSRAL